MRLTVLGAGRMGVAIARRAACDHDVRLWNRTAAKAVAASGEGVVAVASLADAVAGADAVLSILTDGDAVRAVLLDEEMLKGLSRDTVVIEASTIDAAAMEEVAQRYAERGIPLLGAAVSGTPGVVTAGNASVLVSGDPGAQALARPTLAAFASRTVAIGAGIAHAKLVKIGINAVLAGTMQLLAESVVLLEASGVDREAFAPALAGSVLASPFTGYKMGALLARDYEPTFTTTDLGKDVGLALRQADAAGVRLPAAEQMRQLLSDAQRLGFGGLDFLSLVPALQVRNGFPADVPTGEGVTS